MKVRWPQMGLQWLQWALFVLGIALLTWCGLIIAEARFFQAQQLAALEHMSISAPYSETRGTPMASAVVAPGVIGELDIPRLKLSAVVAAGDGRRRLRA